MFADKIAVRDYVRQRLSGTENLTELYATVDSADEIPSLSLPDRFVMKPSHMSGEVKVVSHPSDTAGPALVALGARWLRQNYGLERGEWAYRNVRPRIMFEELLGDGSAPLIDWKFHCFNGDPRLLSLFRHRFGPAMTIDLYSAANFRLLPERFTDHPISEKPILDPPANYGQMLSIARKLSAGVDYVRVDLYNINGRVVFGELTNYPGSGLLKFDHIEFDQALGRYWPTSSPR